MVCRTGYNGGFGNASAFFMEVFHTRASFSNAALSGAPNSQRYGSAFRRFNALDPLGTVPFLGEHFPNGAHLWLKLPGFQRPGGSMPDTPWLARRLNDSHPSRKNIRRRLFKTMNDTQIEVGKYLVSPLARQQGEGRYAASVSIRSGRGSGTHDRILRFTAIFDTAAAALHYATEHAMGWIHERSHPVCT